MILNTIIYLISLLAALGCAYPLTRFSVYFWLMAIPFWLILYYVVFGLWLVVLIFWGKAFKKKPIPDKPSAFYCGVMHQTVVTLFWAINIHVRVRGAGKLPKEKVLYVNNHISNFDQMAMIATFRHPMVAVTKPENLKFPIAGPFVKMAGFIPINREDPKEGAKSIAQAGSYLKDGLADVNICPEGTRNKTDQLLLEFHVGSFRAAMDVKAPIAVLCIKGTKEISKRAPWRPTFVYLDILKVIKPEEYESLNPSQVRDMAVNLIRADLEGGMLYELYAL